MDTYRIEFSQGECSTGACRRAVERAVAVLAQAGLEARWQAMSLGPVTVGGLEAETAWTEGPEAEPPVVPVEDVERPARWSEVLGW